MSGGTHKYFARPSDGDGESGELPTHVDASPVEIKGPTADPFAAVGSDFRLVWVKNHSNDRRGGAPPTHYHVLRRGRIDTGRRSAGASRRVGDDNRIWRIKRLQSHCKIGSFGGAVPRRSDPDDEAGDDAEPHFQPLWQIEAADRIDDNEAIAYGLLAICCNALERLRLSSRRSSQIPPLQQESLTALQPKAALGRVARQKAVAI
jgi:hypothetical protein